MTLHKIAVLNFEFNQLYCKRITVPVSDEQRWSGIVAPALKGAGRQRRPPQQAEKLLLRRGRGIHGTRPSNYVLYFLPPLPKLQTNMDRAK